MYGKRWGGAISLPVAFNSQVRVLLPPGYVTAARKYAAIKNGRTSERGNEDAMKYAARHIKFIITYYCILYIILQPINYFR